MTDMTDGTLETLRQGEYVAYKRALLKISTIYLREEPYGYVTAQVVLDHDGQKPSRTLVREYPRDLIMEFRAPTARMIRRADEQYSATGPASRWLKN